jgi:hypothetical protein
MLANHIKVSQLDHETLTLTPIRRPGPLARTQS